MPDAGAAASLAIRAARLDDAGTIGGIAQRAWEATYRGMIPDAVLDEWKEAAPENWRAALGSPVPDSPRRRWVAERGGSVIGYAVTAPAEHEWLPPPDGAGEITSLYLEPDAIGTGVGRALYRHAVEDLRARGFRPLVVWAFRENARALAFYERMGLSIDVPHHDWVLDGVPCPIVRFTDGR